MSAVRSACLGAYVASCKLCLRSRVGLQYSSRLPLAGAHPSEITPRYKFTTSCASNSQGVEFIRSSSDDDETPSSTPLQEKNNDVVSRVVSQAGDPHTSGRLYAIVQLRSQQYKVTDQDLVLFTDYIMADIGARITLDKVLMVGGRDFSIFGRPMLSADVVRVEGTVIEKTLSQVYYSGIWHRTYGFGYRRLKMRRYPRTVVRINCVKVTSPTTLLEGTTDTPHHHHHTTHINHSSS